MARLTHLDAEGRARMVDVGEKEATRREAEATATVSMSAAAFARLGDVFVNDAFGSSHRDHCSVAERSKPLMSAGSSAAISSGVSESWPR